MFPPDIEARLEDRERRILAGVPVSRLHPKRPELANLLLVAASECTTEDDMDALETGLKEVLR